jgi:hypothetical protein
MKRSSVYAKSSIERRGADLSSVEASVSAVAWGARPYAPNAVDRSLRGAYNWGRMSLVTTKEAAQILGLWRRFLAGSESLVRCI